MKRVIAYIDGYNLYYGLFLRERRISGSILLLSSNGSFVLTRRLSASSTLRPQSRRILTMLTL